MRPRVVLLGEGASENLGDQVIRVCMEHVVRSLVPEVEIRSVDLSGRTSTGGARRERGPWRSAVRKGVRLLPGQTWKDRARWRTRGGRRLRDELAAAVDGADLVLFGGGNLLVDRGGFFPRRLETAGQALGAGATPWGFVACGAREDWSARAAAAFRPLLDSDRCLAVDLRDHGSARAIDAEVPALHGRTTVSGDVGLFSGDCLLAPLGRTEVARSGVGVGVLAPEVIARHWSDKEPPPGPREVRRFFRDVALEIATRGEEVEIFGNGSRSDHQLVARTAASAANLAGGAAKRIRAAPRPRSPQELVARIAGRRAILAHRLHAVVVAAAVGVPFAALTWDPKIDGFVELMGVDRPRSSERGLPPAAEIADTLLAPSQAPALGVAVRSARARIRAVVGSVLERAGLPRISAEPPMAELER